MQWCHAITDLICCACASPIHSINSSACMLILMSTHWNCTFYANSPRQLHRIGCILSREPVLSHSSPRPLKQVGKLRCQRANCVSRHVVPHPCIRLTASCGTAMIYGQQPPLVLNSQLASRIHRSVPSSSKRSVIMRITEVTNGDQVVKGNIQIVVTLQPQTHTQVETACRKPISN